MREKGGFVDPFRPQVEPNGFASLDDLRADRDLHLAEVRRMFEGSDVFVFTLGLTEAWECETDGAVVPLAPGVGGAPSQGHPYAFHNFTVAEMSADLDKFVEHVRSINPALRIILTVSPVPLIATYEDQHVLTSTVYSKSALRVVAGEAERRLSGVAYFPSYEIVTGPHHGYRFFEPDLRSVSPAGVAHVMSLFARHYLADDEAADRSPAQPAVIPDKPSTIAAEHAAMRDIVCDEEAIEAAA